MQNNQIILNRLISAVESRNAATVAELLADDVVFENISENEATRGKQAVTEKFANFFANVTSIHWDIKRQLINGDIAITELENNLNFQGKKVALPMVNVIEFKHGKIQLFRDYFDAQTFNKQLAA